jgi:hypothetical protein
VAINAPVTIFNQLVQADSLTFDNVDFVRVNQQIRVTSHPVELGVEVSDHAQVEPLEVQIRGRITETPVGTPAPGAVELALSFFERNERQAVTVTMRRGVFADMFVTAYPWPDEGKGEIVFDVTLRKVRFATAIAIAIPARQPSPETQAGSASTADAGAQPPTPTPSPDPRTSFLGVVVGA